MASEISNNRNQLFKYTIFPRTLKAAAWLGWQIESNWADPFVFAIYAVIKPLASAAILVVMYSVITNGAFENQVFPYIYLGNAFYIYVGAVMGGISWAVIDDREHYKMLKYMYVAPIHIPTYLVGRGIARFIFGSISVLITITFGVLFLKVPLVFGEINWVLLVISLLVGLLMLVSMGPCQFCVDHSESCLVPGGRSGRGFIFIQWGNFSPGGAATLAEANWLCNAINVLAGVDAPVSDWRGGSSISNLGRILKCPIAGDSCRINPGVQFCCIFCVPVLRPPRP